MLSKTSRVPLASKLLAVKKWRFAEVDYSSAKDDFGGFYNASSRPNSYAFATLQADGSIKAWGTPTMEALYPNSN
jgi:hypothetical protein